MANNIIKETTNRKGGSVETLKKTQDTTPAGKVCTHKDCPHAGVPQPLDEFDNQYRAKDGKASNCKTCRRIWQRKNISKKKKKPTPKKTPKTKPLPKEAIDRKITIDFTNHQEVYDSLVELAEDKLRDPKGQALWIFIKLHEKGLKTFPELAQ